VGLLSLASTTFSVRFSCILTIILSPVSAECLPSCPVRQMTLILVFLWFILFVHAILLFVVCLEINRSCVELNTCRGRRSTMTSLHLFVQHDAQLSASRGSVCGNWYLNGSVRYYTVSFWEQANRQCLYHIVSPKTTIFVYQFNIEKSKQSLKEICWTVTLMFILYYN